jgi:hypothetical protein
VVVVVHEDLSFAAFCRIRWPIRSTTRTTSTVIAASSLFTALAPAILASIYDLYCRRSCRAGGG